VTKELLANVLDAHGGRTNWERVDAVSAGLVLGGPFWTWRGWPDAELKLIATLDAHREHIALAPFSAPNLLSFFDADTDRLAIQTADGQLVEERFGARATFPPFDLLTTRWDRIQVAYFASAANWNYLTQPFSFTYPGVQAREIEPWREDDQVWRRLAVTFPETNANHNADQVFYYDSNFMLRRMDYAPEVTGNSQVAHYTHDPKTFDGFVFPTRRLVHRRNADAIADQSVAAITVDVTHVDVDKRL
jgi:hypothetical protein